MRRVIKSVPAMQICIRRLRKGGRDAGERRASGTATSAINHSGYLVSLGGALLLLVAQFHGSDNGSAKWARAKGPSPRHKEIAFARGLFFSKNAKMQQRWGGECALGMKVKKGGGGGGGSRKLAAQTTAAPPALWAGIKSVSASSFFLFFFSFLSFALLHPLLCCLFTCEQGTVLL
ncbi:uncharacterized protein LY79DRAFT_94460 [Colletotrichum navitas]|uniref:Uncharacterized protein n=1 Tax=Colletotrichum navitas TaxID=681940 RepID=A0AAD8V835_9PEZI|nr:uncharacterized protein LY79DRAFT_94460 [Colletotrichum navitas]KAK1595848.1 hypothetical protein LY79DRAFT_94460 [Colletotrichum navitas]